MSARRPLVALSLLFLGACSSPKPPPPTYQGTLAVDIENHVAVTLVTPSDREVDVTLHFLDGSFGLFDASKPLTATGRIEPFPEVPMVLYTAQFSSPPIATGPCGSQPISLGLALSRRENNARVGGSLAAYCGANQFSGVPTRILRLMGDAPKNP